MHTPLKFPNSPEGKRLLQAREEFWKVVEQIKQYTNEGRANRGGPAVYAVYANGSYVEASKECESAKRAYYMATGDESQLELPPIPRERWTAFQKSVEKYFSKIAEDLNSKLVRVLPWIYGFATVQVVVILEVVELDRGIPPSLIVTLRRRDPVEKIGFSSELGHRNNSESSVALWSIVRSQNPKVWENRLKSNSDDDLSDEALRHYAEMLLEYGKSFLTDPNADWAGMQKWLQQERGKIFDEQPWLKKFSRP